MLYKRRTLPVTLLSLSLFSVNSHAAQSYQTEFFGGYEKRDANTSTDKFTTLSAEIYFSPVNTENKPLVEAAFLDKSSSVILGHIKQKTDLQNANVNSFDVNGPAIAINYITETNAFILGAIYSNRDFDTDNNLVTGDSKTIGFNIGKYLNDSSIVEFSYINSDTKTRNTTSNQTFSNDTDQYNISYNTIQSLDATSYYGFGASIELIQSDSSLVKEDNHVLAIQGQYYFTRMTSLGVETSFNSGDNVSREGKTLEISAAHFLTPKIALNISTSKFIADDSLTEDTDSISVEAIARF